MPITEGVNRAGDKWKKQEFLFEYFEHDTDRYTEKVALSIMNDRIRECDLHECDEVTIGFGHTVREYQGRYYNDLRCYMIKKADSMPVQPAQSEEAASDMAARLETMQKQAEEMQKQRKGNLPF